MGEENTTREKLVEAARDLFLFQGYNGTGVAEIVKRAGVRPGSLYYFFPTKEDLLVAVLEWYRDNIYDGLLKYVWERVDDPIERIFGILDGYRQILELYNYDMGCPIGNLALELSNSHPKIRDLIQVNFQQWMDAIKECLDRAEGRLPANLDKEALATHILVTMEGAVMLARSWRSIDTFDQAISQLRDYFDRLLADGTEWVAPRGARYQLSGDE